MQRLDRDSYAFLIEKNKDRKTASVDHPTYGIPVEYPRSSQKLRVQKTYGPFSFIATMERDLHTEINDIFRKNSFLKIPHVKLSR